MKHKLHIHRIHIVLIFGVLLFLGGCRLVKSAELRALEDVASVLQLTTGREVKRWTQDKGTALGKPVYAEIYIEYEPIYNYSKKEVYDEIIAILERNNWERDEWNIDPDYFNASLKKNNITLIAGVLIRSEKNLVTVRMTNRDR
jgi:hypothetical protein